MSPTERSAIGLLSPIFGQELWADLAVDEALLRDSERLRASLRHGAAALGCTVLSEHCQEFEPCGLTAVVIIGESHLLASTYEELGILAVNIQSCSRGMDLLEGLRAICVHVAASEIRSLVVMRRIDTPMRLVIEERDVPIRDGRICLPEAVSSGSDPRT